MLTACTLSSHRHTTRYWEAGPIDGPLMIFLHGWPEIALTWRFQMEAFAVEGEPVLASVDPVPLSFDDDCAVSRLDNALVGLM